ncbi:MAG: 30S ribosomal protein S20 [Acetivibrionales bacterium]
MPNIKSAIKRAKTSKARNMQNTMMKSALKTSVKKAKESIANKSENATDVLKSAIKALDKAAAKKIIHKNTAARKISRLTKAFNNANVK